MSSGSVKKDSATERQRQEKCGEQNHTDPPWLPILTEEAREIAHAICGGVHGDPSAADADMETDVSTGGNAIKKTGIVDRLCEELRNGGIDILRADMIADALHALVAHRDELEREVRKLREELRDLKARGRAWAEDEALYTGGPL